ncbi:hypothetical protein C0J52_17755 [Blattella germanica]|nr:hypothetical protein C0J52_17755 [Blattella germanica]
MQPEDPLIRCPYNQSHQILKSRMQVHIVKCRRNYPTADKVVCLFNAIHHLDKINYQYHVSTCPDRRVVECQKYEVYNSLGGDVNRFEYKEPELPPNEEDWDKDAEVSHYDPSEHIENALILRSLQGATKSQRKAFRLRERLRIQRILDGEPPASPSSTTTSSNSAGENPITPLRLPHKRSEAVELLDPNLGLGRGRGSIINREIRAPGNGASAQVTAPRNEAIAEACALENVAIAQASGPEEGATGQASASEIRAIESPWTVVHRCGSSFKELPALVVGRGKLLEMRK